MRLIPLSTLLVVLLSLPGTLLAVPESIAKPFETSLSFDALLTRGNANKGEIGSKIETEGATPFFESVRGGGLFVYGKSEVESVETTTAKRWELFGTVRRPWERNKTYTFLDGKVQSDDVADLHYRVTEGGGVGLYLMKEEKAEWSIESGLSWVFEETGDGTDNYPAIRLGERFEREWEGGPKVTQKVELLPHALQLGQYLLNSDVELTTVITKALNLRTAMEYHYQSDPPEETESYDFRLVVGVTCKF